MELPMIIVFILLAVGIILAIKILKGAFKIAFAIAGLVVLSVMIILGAAYFDVKKLNTLLDEGDKIMLYQEEGELLAGVKIGEEGFLIKGTGTLPESIEVFNKTKLLAYQENISSKKTSVNELIFVISNDSFANISTITLNEFTISKEVFDKVMMSDEPKKDIIKESLQFRNIPPEQRELVSKTIEQELSIFSDQELKSALFLVALNQLVEEQGETYLLKLINEEKIVVYPDFFLIRLVGVVPEKLFEKTLSKVISLKEEKVEGEV